ncbi:acetyltransferase [Noviherbaspirillum humi]|uniref:Acetyltransferase n=1 Tax=Noviherbaspirillum humi TaxID=1688639 RepID=A0A239HBQ3_9BURK|nr:bifunctional acetate--CoA ligase family protein/GNAT family N-acetyltransferase [Noviherbaspirillum humi]SNS78829.1 acetyltransferase [Noviherbaspirillum humi]
MSIRNLKFLFQPRSVAIIGATVQGQRIGEVLQHNLSQSEFTGSIWLVNPNHQQLGGQPMYPDVPALPQAPELALICTPAHAIPAIVSDLGRLGTRAAIVLTPDVASARMPDGRPVRQAMLEAAKPWLLRLLGPDSVGLLIPRLHLNASYAHADALPGTIAFVSQSGAMVTAVLDWAKSRGIGFSKFVSLGECADIDIGDVLDYLATDGETRAILLYAESIADARKFMSAARAAARSKPTLIIKAGREAQSAQAAASHTGALAGADYVFDAAIRRAGMLRVASTEDLFDAVETLARGKPVRGGRLAIITNGGGPGVMALDSLLAEKGQLAQLSKETVAGLKAMLPANWKPGHSIDLQRDADAERYLKAIEIVLADGGVDAVLVIHAPNAIVSNAEIARAVAPAAQRAARQVLACWMGRDSVSEARTCFAAAGIPSFDTPEKAVRGFMQMVQYQRNQRLLMEVPTMPEKAGREDRRRARAMVQQALADGRSILSEPEAKRVLAAYGIPVVQTRTAASAEEAARLAQEIGFPVALKIVSPDVPHKSDVGGVALDLASPAALLEAAGQMQRRLHAIRPEARLNGWSVQAMARKPEGVEIIIGISTDPVFGPVVLFGQGGIAVEVTHDHAIGLPPLNTILAREMISRTRVAALLAGYRHRRPADIDAICATLIQVSDMVIGIPEIAEMDINPLLVDADGLVALDARIQLRRVSADGVSRLAIRPYPVELEEHHQWQGGDLLLRPIRPEDGAEHVRFFNQLHPDDVRYRIFSRMRELQPHHVARLTQIDYDREMAFIASWQGAGGRPETVGVVRAISDPEKVSAEFAIIVRSDMKGRGLGSLLMAKLVAYCRAIGLKEIIGETLSDNKGLIHLARRFGFSTRPGEEGVTALRLVLASPA